MTSPTEPARPNAAQIDAIAQNVKNYTHSPSDIAVLLAEVRASWADAEKLREALRAARAEIEELHAGMDVIAGHDRSGLDHLDEMMKASEERDMAEAVTRQLRTALADLVWGTRGLVRPLISLTVNRSDYERARALLSESVSSPESPK